MPRPKLSFSLMIVISNNEPDKKKSSEQKQKFEKQIFLLLKFC